MTTLKIQIDCDEKTCGECYNRKGNPPVCGVFSQKLANTVVEPLASVPYWEIYRCPQCLAAQEEDGR